jgi:hypothetical protein
VSAGVSSGPPDAAVGKGVPKAFLGTWEGPFDVDFAGSTLRTGTFTVVIGPGKAGAKIGTVNQFDALGSFACEDNLVLRSATAAELVVEGESSDKSGNTCTPGKHTVKLRITGAGLQYTSDEPRAGNPRALLKRAD